MKKKSCLTLALILVMVQLISLFAVVPASAATAGYSHSYIFKIDDANDPYATKESGEDLLEGSPEWLKQWENVPARELICYTANANRPQNTSFSGSVKVAWAENDDTTIKLYFLIDVQDNTPISEKNNKNLDGVFFSVKPDTNITADNRHEDTYYTTQAADTATSYKENLYKVTHRKTWTQLEGEANCKGLSPNVIMDLNQNGYKAQLQFVINKPAKNQICFDIMVRDCFDNNSVEDYSIAGGSPNSLHLAAYTYNASGVYGNIVDAAPIGMTSTEGASIRVDTANAKQSGIRFANSINVASYNALVEAGATITTGTLILPTNNLKAGTVFTKEGLATAGLVEGTHYYDIVNEGNEWVDGKAGTWYGTLFDIKNFTREFSAIGYVTVTIGGVSVTYYGQYEDSYARSIAEVATAAKNDNNANWSTEELAILNGFCGN